jgi:hypothetical protein
MPQTLELPPPPPGWKPPVKKNKKQITAEPPQNPEQSQAKEPEKKQEQQLEEDPEEEENLGPLNPSEIINENKRLAKRAQLEERHRLMAGKVWVQDGDYSVAEPPQAQDPQSPGPGNTQDPQQPWPQQAEKKEPHTGETSKQNADKKGKEIAAAGPNPPGARNRPAPPGAQPGPMMPIGAAPGGRPQPDKNKNEQGSVIVAKHLAPQLGSDPDHLAEGRWDERKLAVLTEEDVAAMSHFSYRYVYDGIRYWGHTVEWWLIGTQGVNGRGRSDILKVIGAATGVQSREIVQKPGVLARNLFNRDWRQKADAQGQEVRE